MHDGYTPKYEKFYYVAFLLSLEDRMISEVKINNQSAEFVSQGDIEQRVKQLDDSPVNCWYYNESIRIFFVKVFDEPSLKIEATYS